MSGLDENWVDADETYSLECAIEQVKPRAKVYWSIAGIVSAANHDQDTEQENGIWSIVGTLDHSFSYDPENQEVKCVVTDYDDEQNVLLERYYKTVQVRCKYCI